MIKSMRIFLMISLIMTSFLFYRCGKKDTDEPKEITVNIYLVALEGSTLRGKTIGCKDILVPISKNVLIEKNVVESAMNELFAAKSTDELKNFIKGPALFLYQVTLSNGIAEIYFKGDFHISAVCDILRIKEQLYETAKQFPEVKEVKIFINAQSLESYLSLAKQGFN
jgi:hypothetical protein